MEMEIGFWSYGRLQEDKKELGEEEEEKNVIGLVLGCLLFLGFTLFIFILANLCLVS